MISYKKINLLDLSITPDFVIQNKNIDLQIKSPIIMYSIKDSLLCLQINKNSDTHNLFQNLCGYIDRLFKIKNVESHLINDDNIILNIEDSSKFYDENSKITLRSNIKKEGKTICSFKCDNGKFTLNQFLSLK